MNTPLLAVEGLCVRLTAGPAIVEDLDLSVDRGEILAVVGESGSGKTTTALAILGANTAGTYLAGGRVVVSGQSVLDRPERQRRTLRSRLVGYVPQEPGSALNPALRIGRQIGEIVAVHAPGLDRATAVRRALGRVGLPDDRGFQRRYPHQLSGGQQQRVAIAQALVLEPPLLVLDEPTTGLDAVTQAALLEEVRRLRDETGIAVVYVTHDIAAASGLADRLGVMYAGRIVEEGPTRVLLQAPGHPYSAGLIGSVPDPSMPRRLTGISGVAAAVGHRPPGCAFSERCRQRVEACVEAVPRLQEIAPGHWVRCPEWLRTPSAVALPLPAPAPACSTSPLLEVQGVSARHRSGRMVIEAVRHVSFSVAAGECVSLVGESGSGKTTIARCLVGLHPPAEGAIRWRGELLAAHARRRTREQRRRIQLVFQNPYDSLNPRRTVGSTIARAARLLRGMDKATARDEVRHLLRRVRLSETLAERYPGELSGGERQRVALARALAAGPELLVCDEITSALDVSVQAAVLDLLGELRRALGLAVLFISHDLGVVASVADWVAVLEGGVIQEIGSTSKVLHDPSTPYARRLTAAAARLPSPHRRELGTAEKSAEERVDRG